MIFYHGTSTENWQMIKQEGLLWGKRDAPSRCTYLAENVNEAAVYGDVVLEIEYNPTDSKYCNNWSEGCWQHREYNPIPLTNVRIHNEISNSFH